MTTLHFNGYVYDLIQQGQKKYCFLNQCVIKARMLKLSLESRVKRMSGDSRVLQLTDMGLIVATQGKRHIKT